MNVSLAIDLKDSDYFERLLSSVLKSYMDFTSIIYQYYIHYILDVAAGSWLRPVVTNLIKFD